VSRSRINPAANQPGGWNADSRVLDLLYGRNSIAEALRSKRAIHRLLVARGTHGLEPLIGAAQRRGISVDLVQRDHLDRLLHAAHHQGVAAQADPFPYVHIDDLLAEADRRAEPPLLLALDSLQDPQNFGTLMRTALASGAHGVLIPEHRAVGITPAVSNASAGAVEHLKVAQVTNLARALGELKSRGVWVHGLAGEADQPYWDTDLSGSLALVVGAEGGGLGRLVREACDVTLRIPMAEGAIQSLNASVAGSLVLYEAFRQRRQSRAR
jgi:23S rRNA (guanosine2251-2'-O)-methyltransferase